ncbi:MAG: hypothetical protein R3B07_01045 [Polyangiaceae bacterium]
MAVSSCALLLLGSVACSSADGGSSHTGTQDSEIINGSLDTTRQAVVTILAQDAACSGTIVAKDTARGIGYVLTAAHCVDSAHPPVEVRQGNDYANPDRVYGVISYAQHPAYGGGNTQNDVGMIRIAGVDASTPTLDIGFSTSVTNGMGVMSVGYGITGNGSNNTRRYNITKNLNGVNSAIIQYSLTGGGICSGDSGGPVLSPTSGTQQVIAVHSSVSNGNGVTCSGTGYSVRVSYHESFITSFINEQVAQTCDVCQQVAQSGACSSAIDACINDSACYALVTCFNGCNDNACYQTCANNNPGGVALYNAIIDCTCMTCATECAQECAGPACGFQFQDDACTTCHEANCCQEGADCADDSECTTCVTDPNANATTCANNAALNAWDSCLATSCATECNINTGGSGGTGGSAGSGGSGGSAGSAGNAGTGGAGGSAGTAGSAGSGVGGNAGTGAAGSGAGGSGATSQGGTNATTGGSTNGEGTSSSATCTLSVANSGHGSGTVGGLMLLGMLGLGLRRRRHD